MTDTAVLLQQVINGLSLGAMYALLALGFTLVYGILELINFAHFNVFMVASFIGMWALEMLGLSGQSQVLTGMALFGTLAFAFAVTMLAAGALGVAIERIALPSRVRLTNSCSASIRKRVIPQISTSRSCNTAPAISQRTVGSGLGKFCDPAPTVNRMTLNRI